MHCRPGLFIEAKTMNPDQSHLGPLCTYAGEIKDDKTVAVGKRINENRRQLSETKIKLYCANQSFSEKDIWAAACDFQQVGILTSVDSDEPPQPPIKLRNSKWCSVSSLTIIEYSSDWQRLWSDCAYAQADLGLCWSHIPNCWKSHALAHF